MQPISIYIVEDELLISASLKSQLQNFGYEISGSAMSGETCLADIAALSKKGKEPEIVLMDIHLRGEMDGIETAKKVNEQFNCAIIFLTGQSSKEVYDRSFKIKPFGYLLKPIDMEQTKMTVEIAAYQRNLEIENKRYQKNLEMLLEKRSQENLELMAMYHSIIDNSMLGMTIVQDDKIVFINQRAAELFGYSVEEFITFSVDKLLAMIHPDDQEKILSLSQLWENVDSLPVRLQFKAYTRDKEIKNLESHFKIIYYQGKPALHQTYLDITDYFLPRML